ncbi:MAG TPA: adenylate/guanylate cyclase domain-containing protein, partial [Ilumatobacteraceae bacterium]|nr:adenylate/guanylate cyclase domain-containing protein [Ilumatobacteraceae bacterium]
MPGDLPAGTVTFLFTDIEDSTRLWEESPERITAALEVHDGIVRGAIQRHAGYVFATGGDGFCAAFSTAPDAASAAVEMQQELLADPVVILFRVRIGLHTGEATERNRDYFGPEVNRAARLMSTAHGGQIVVSDTTRALLQNQLTLRPLGEHRLRGLGRRMTLHQVVADGLPSEFPPLRSMGSFAGNLPQQLSSFIGRDQLLSEVADLLRVNRLVTLSGVGGVGKTRLALEVGAEMADEFPDGVWLVELAPVGDPSSVPAAIATALGITPQGDAELIDTVAEAVAARRLLLVVDNCEHVLDAAGAAIARILGRAGNAKVLSTSREYLWVAGETLLSVSPLALEGGIASDAVKLFVERASAARAGFGLYDTQSAAAVTEICETLDGLPLGIELAAARMATMSAVEVRDRLGDRFRMLRGSERQPERQQTLQLAVGWSYDLLSDDERVLLRNASVFAGGFDLNAIASVVDGADEVDVLERLDSLVRKSLVVVNHAAHTRYGMFETIRQFAEAELSVAGGLARMRDRHAAYFAASASHRYQNWNGPGWRAAVDWVEIELDNLRTAFRWSMQQGDLDVATDVAAHAALMGFSVQLFETLGWAEELLPAAAAADVRRLPRLYTGAGYACFAGRAEAAAANAHRATELETTPGYDACEPGYATFIEALGQVYCGHLDRYIELTGAVAALPKLETRAYAIAAYLDGLQSAGRVDEALELTDSAVAAARELGNPYWISYTLWIVGLALSKVDKKRALLAWDEGSEVVRESRVRFFEGFIGRDAARLHTAEGEADAALKLLGPAIESFHQAGNVPQLIITLASVPALFERVGQLDAAATLLGALSRESSSLHHVPELVELGQRLTAQLGEARSEELTNAGAMLDLNDAAAYAREQIELTRKMLTRQARHTIPAGLTRREVDVLRLIAEGRATREIAEQLFISSKTADNHIQHIYTKLA